MRMEALMKKKQRQMGWSLHCIDMSSVELVKAHHVI